MITEEQAIQLLQRTAQHIEEGVQTDLDAGNFGGAMEALDVMRDATRWVQGDLINDAKSLYGTTAAYKLAAKALGANMRWAIELSRVADIFPPEFRRADVPWQMYRAAAMHIDPYTVLEDALETGKTSNEVRAAAKGGRDAMTPTPLVPADNT